MTFLGFSSGLPFLLVFSTLTVWLTEGNVSRSTIGFFAWIGITYSIKVLWAPVVDSIPIPMLTKTVGQRRSWMLVGQIGVACGLVLMSLIGPSDLLILSACAFLVAFSFAFLRPLFVANIIISNPMSCVILFPPRLLVYSTRIPLLSTLLFRFSLGG